MRRIEPASVLVPRLTIELVPKTCWYTNVRSNVPKNYWDMIRKQVYIMAGHQCEVCGGVGSRHPVECHEVWHYDDVNYIQKLNGMVALCPACHSVKHIGRASMNGYFNISLRHLSQVNDWDLDTAARYIRHQKMIWEERSQHEWKLDISVLHKYTRPARLDTW